MPKKIDRRGLRALQAMRTVAKGDMKRSRLRDIRIRVIEPGAQRYETVGDWYLSDDGVLDIRVSSMLNWKFEALVALHELVEVFLCAADGVTQEEVDRFDMAFRSDGEPGDCPESPYFMQHQIAEFVERHVQRRMRVSEPEYVEAVTFADIESTAKLAGRKK